MPRRYWIAPVCLFMLQNAPVTIESGPGGGLRLGFGGAIGSYEEQGVNCEGEVISRERRRFKSIGAEASGRIAPTIRVTGHAGHMWTSSEAGSILAPPFEGFFAGIMGGLDDANLAMGVGISTAPGGVDSVTSALSNRILPMGFVRLGQLDRLHFRVEVGGPPVPGAPPELGRAGLGFRLGDRRRIGFRLDLGVSDFPLESGENHLLLDALVRLPLGQAFDLGLLGTLRDPSGGDFAVYGQLRR
jgi:hypothetical protein